SNKEKENQARKRKQSPQNRGQTKTNKKKSFSSSVSFILFNFKSHQLNIVLFLSHCTIVSRSPTQMVKAKQSQVWLRKSWWRVSWPGTLTLLLLLTCSFLILIPLALRILSTPHVNSSSALSKPNDLNSVPRNTHVSEGENNRVKRWVEVMSWEPRAFLYHNFLTKEECEYLINTATPNMLKSLVIDNESGEGIETSYRTSTEYVVERGKDKIVRNIEKRIADVTFIPIEHGEPLHVIRYAVGQYYEPHVDYFEEEFSLVNGGQRIATMLMYLSNVEGGGETVFPIANANFSSVPWWNELSECGQTGLSIKPKMGDALLFWSMKPDATLDPLTLHRACPVIKGNKWSCTKWMHANEYET
ncbi:putative prolyl 4-hydroxylase 10 isoform B, partial [Glycine soja]